jgi:hypothetical protein
MLYQHLRRIISIVSRNFQLKKKSDDYELFLGKSGKNVIIGPAEKIKKYHDWMNVVLKYNMEHINTLYEQENFEIIMDTCISTIVGSKERVDKNLGYLGHIGQISGFINSLNAALLD